MSKRTDLSHRLERAGDPTLRNWDRRGGPAVEKMRENAVVEMGWGRLLFGHTFESNEELARTLCREKAGRRDLALYLRDPHVVLSLAPQELFLDPSHTYRLWLHRYRPARRQNLGVRIRRIQERSDAEEINRIYQTRHMATSDPGFMLERKGSRIRIYLVAEEVQTGKIVGTVTGVDHTMAFRDPENGSSLWCLAVDPQAATPGVGEALVRHLAERFLARNRDYMDLSVLHDNEQAIALYEKLGFQRVPAFCVKHKNPINEPLFIAPALEEPLNPYARIIVDEARRRGMVVEVQDAPRAYFTITFGGRTVACRESLSELTNAVAMSRCQDKRVTLRMLKEAGLCVPAQCSADDARACREFLEDHGRVVVKPADGEQGAGVAVGLETMAEVEAAVEEARRVSREVVLEECIDGLDLRVVVIDGAVVAAAVRRPPQVLGTGRHSVAKLIEKYSRRRAAATGGESTVPLDEETKRCVTEAGHTLESVLPLGDTLPVRRTANLHTGGTIHDVTADLHPDLAAVSVKAAAALDIPVVGLDLIVPRVDGPAYHILEANERVGLANHEPQPTAERFLDFLFPQSAARSG